jgi:dCMP deaminase
MTRSTWDTVWAEVAQAVSRRSACDRAQVGAVLVRNNRVVSTGYNGPASGYPADTDQGCSNWCSRAAGPHPSPEAGYGFACPSIHAEANALLHASRDDTEGATLYITNAPCADCAKLISNSGVAEVVYTHLPAKHRPDPVPYLQSCGIRVRWWAL